MGEVMRVIINNCKPSDLVQAEKVAQDFMLSDGFQDRRAGHSSAVVYAPEGFHVAFVAMKTKTGVAVMGQYSC